MQLGSTRSSVAQHAREARWRRGAHGPWHRREEGVATFVLRVARAATCQVTNEWTDQQSNTLRQPGSGALQLTLCTLCTATQ